MLTIGVLSMIFASGIFPADTRFAGNTDRAAGDVPKLHRISAPEQTIMKSPAQV
jgi:hypothetical protein